MALTTDTTSTSGEAAGAAKFSSAATTGALGAGQVFMGLQSLATPSARLSSAALQSLGDLGAGAVRSASGQTKQPNWATTQQALDSFYGWSAKQLGSFMAKAALGGLLQPGDGVMEADALWQKLVKEAAAYGAQGAQVSPMDILASYVGSGGGAKPFARTTTQKQVDLTDPDTAKALATSVWQQLLGRDPNPGELGSFAGALQTAEQNNPSMTTTTTQYDAQGNATSSSSTNSGGMTDAGRQYLAEQQIKANPEFGATQAATTYMNALESAIYGAHG